MTPAQLSVDSFKAYLPKARHLAVSSVGLLRQLPLGFTPFLLKEIINADYKFPKELQELEDQLAYLNAMPTDRRKTEMQPFANLKLNSALEAYDWINSPGQFLEQLSAHMWATKQMDGFRKASEAYVGKFHASLKPAPLDTARVAVIVIGQGVSGTMPAYSPFLRLKREGTLYTQVKSDGDLKMIHRALEDRATRIPGPYLHWCLDGGSAPSLNGFSTVGYGQLAPVRDALAGQMLAAYQTKHFDPEKLRTDLARTTYEGLGIQPSGDMPLEHFALTLLTEGSGTQIYSTTFVQWAAREALRRAQPLTLFARYSPRQRERSMDELLRGAKSTVSAETDPFGSLIDADMGAYYTWLNQQRLPGADQSRFLVWCETQSMAVIVSPAHKRGTVDGSPTGLEKLLQEVVV